MTHIKGAAAPRFKLALMKADGSLNAQHLQIDRTLDAVVTASSPRCARASPST